MLRCSILFPPHVGQANKNLKIKLLLIVYLLMISNKTTIEIFIKTERHHVRLRIKIYNINRYGTVMIINDNLQRVYF